MYTITFPIPVYRQNSHIFLVPTGLARDVLAHCEYVRHLRIICLTAMTPEALSDFVEVDLRKHPRLSIRQLPWDGHRGGFYLGYTSMKSILTEEARQSEVWHTCCSIDLLDLASLSFRVGRASAKGLRIVCLDSDPASMLETSSKLGSLKAPLIRARGRRQVSEADAAIFVGAGVESGYGAFAKKFVTTDAVWLQAGELASVDQVKNRFSSVDPIRIVLPSRLTAWKGVDDVIEALGQLKSGALRWQLDVIGDGPEKVRLMEFAARVSGEIKFLPPIPYGPRFFSALQTYHILVAPTRGMEQTRIVFDALASGCVLIHSKTPTLEQALAHLSGRWSFNPGDVSSLREALTSCLEMRSHWIEAALSGIDSMRNRTIDEMHKTRSKFVDQMLRDRSSSTGAN